MPRAEGAYSQEGRMSQASISLKRMDNSRIQGVQHGNRGTAATHGVSDEEPRFKYSPSGPPFPHGPRLGDLSFAHCESTCGCNKFYGVFAKSLSRHANPNSLGPIWEMYVRISLGFSR